MTQLTDKMERLRLKQGEAVPFQAIHFNEAIDKCIALAEAEAVVVVGDWEAELEYIIENFNTSSFSEYKGNIEDFVTILLDAKDREITKAYKKGFIDGGLSN